MTVHQRCRTLFMQKEPDVEEQEPEPHPGGLCMLSKSVTIWYAWVLIPYSITYW